MNIFISYNHKDGVIVNKIANDLNVHKDFTIFYDKLSLDSGKNWITQLEQALKETKAGLIFIGDYGIGNWQEIEIVNLLNAHHSQNNFLLIPVMLPTQGDNLYNNLPFYLKNIQWFQYDEDQHQHCIAGLLNEIRNNRESIRFNKTNPYKGLKAFEKEDALYFFGRTFEINRFFNRKCNFAQGIKPGVNNFCAVVANSGDGKSSFVKAGILSALANSKFENSENWIPVITNPGNNAIEKLCNALYDAKTPKTSLGDKINTRQLEQDLLNYEDALARTLRESTKQTIVIYIDQFEEILTNHPIGESTKVGVVEVDNEIIIHQYLNNIDRARKEENVVIFISLRADFANRFTFHSVFNMLLENHRFNLSTLNLSKVDNRQETTALLTEIIKMPAELNGVEIHNNVVQQIINDCKGLANVLPILQLLMNKLWESYLVNKQTGKPTIATHIYNELTHNKGLQGYINIHADKVYQYLVQENPDNATHIKQIFIPHLISLNTANTDGDLRRIATKAEIVKDNAKKEALLQVLSAENTRLLYIKEAHKGNATVEVIHEVLIREWQLLQKWIEAERGNLNKKDIYESLIQNDPNDILKGNKLREAKKWQKENEHLRSDQITQLLENSQNAQKVRYRGMGFIAAFTTIFMLIFIPVALELYKYNQVLNRKVPKIEDKYILIDNEDTYNFLYDKLYFYKNLEELYLTNLNLDTVRKIKLSQIYYAFKYKSNQLLSKILINNCKFENLNIFIDPNNITTLKIEYNSALKEIKGLSSLKNLTNLSIYSNEVLTEINGLGSLSKLTNLTIYGNDALAEINGLGSLSDLTNLSIYSNDVLTEIEGLKELDSLTSLQIDDLNLLSEINSQEELISLTISYNNTLTKIKGFNLLSNLTNLTIYGNDALTKIEDLDSLPNLANLIITDNDALQDIRGLGSLTNLIDLTITTNDALQDIEGFGSLTNLTNLTIERNDALQDIGGFGLLTNLTNLTIYGNDALTKIEDLDSLTNLTNLTIFDNNILQDIRGLGSLTSLTDLTIIGNDSLKEIGELGSLINLTNLTIRNNDALKIIKGLKGIDCLSSFTIDDLNLLSKINRQKELTNLTIVSNWKLTEIKGLDSLTNLTNLTIMNNKNLKYVRGLNSLTNLTDLTINDNYGLTKIKGLGSLTNLTNLSIYHNIDLTKIEEFDALKSLKTLKTDNKWILKTILKSSKNLDKIETASETIWESDLTYQDFQLNYLGVDNYWPYISEQLSIDLDTLKNNFKHIDTLVIKGASYSQ